MARTRQVTPKPRGKYHFRENSIGAFVRARRRANGLNQQELAEVAGIGLRAVVEIEKGKSTLRLDTLNAVLGVFGKTLGVVDAPREQVEQ